MMRLTRSAALALMFSAAAGFSFSSVAGQPATPKSRYAIALYGKPKYGPDFKHFDYVNPSAPKGGTLIQSGSGTGFDSLNPFILKGNPPDGIDLTYDTLMTSSGDEPFSEYGLVADKIILPKSRDWVEFHINPKARFHDGSPITATDVVYSFHLLMTKGQPGFQNYYHAVKDARVVNPQLVRFDFKTNEDRQLPLILGGLPVLSKHYWEHHKFDTTNLTNWLGSGPYKIGKIDSGNSITYVRDKHYWAKNLPVNKGRYNFDKIEYEYFNDDSVALQAFKAGDLNFRIEMTAKNWATMYQGQKFKDGDLVKAEIPQHEPAGMQAFIYNTRRAVFSDRQVRRALAYAFDFQWTNKQLFYGQYKRTDSYFENSDYANQGLPKGHELALLEPFRKQLPPEVFNQHYEPPTTAGNHSLKGNLRKAFEILKKDGWVYKNGHLVNGKTGKPLSFEILLTQKAFERVVEPFTQNLARLGVDAHIRLVDTSQYAERMKHFDFDMAVMVIPESDDPGDEQRNYWTTAAANTVGSENYAGVRSPVVDQLVTKLINAQSRKDLVDSARALDRVLLWGYYVIPQWYLPDVRVAYSRNLRHPTTYPKSGVDTTTWWYRAPHK